MFKKGTVIALLVLALLATPTATLQAGEVQKLGGSFVWEQRDTRGDVEAVFTPTGENAWDVSFHFEFRGTPHVYSGTARGNLTEGNLDGTVINDDKQRTFTFKGVFKEGKFSGTHAEVEEGKEHGTGTLTLAR